MKAICIDLFETRIIFKVFDKETYNLIFRLFSNIISQSNDTIKKENSKEVDILKIDEMFFLIRYLNYIYKLDKNLLIEKLIDFVSDSFTLIQNKQVAYFHASVVAKEDKCTLIIAPSYNGKTTLSMQLTLMGYEYISDDLAIVNEKGYLLPYPTPIKLRKNHKIDICKFKENYTITELPGYWILTPFKKYDLSKKYKPNKILFLNRNPDTDYFKCSDLSRIETVNKLVNNAAHMEDAFMHSKISFLLSGFCCVFDICYKEFQQILKERKIRL